MAAVHKLIVEVIAARKLLPKDGYGTSSPYVVLDYHGQLKKTKTVVRDLSPVWNEILEFNAGKTSEVFGDLLEITVFHDRSVGLTSRNNFLGRLRLSSSQFVKKGEEALIYYPLEKRNFFSWVRGEIGLKIYFQEEVAVTPPPPPEVNPEPAPPSSSESSEKNVNVEPPTDAEKANVEDTEQVLPPENTNLVAEGNATEGVRLNAPPQINVLPQPMRRVTSASSFISDKSALEGSTFDLVEKMHYLFIRVVKARALPTSGSAVVKISVSGAQIFSNPSRRTAFFDWDQTFAFRHDSPESCGVLEISVWESPEAVEFFGGVCFDASEIPLRDPPDSSLAAQWYRLAGGGSNCGDLMLCTWIGSQADESFPEAWKSDTTRNGCSESKVYQSPKLWYLRATVIEAQDISMKPSLKNSSVHIKAQLGFQVQKTKSVPITPVSPAWNEDLMFVAAEPFTEHDLSFFLIENRPTNERVVIGVARVPLNSIERRVDHRKVASRWFLVEDPNQNEDTKTYRGRLHLRLCFDGGYHVMDEGAKVCSDFRPTARQLWQPPIGKIELGLIGCKNLLPMKSLTGKGSTDAYAVAKYGGKWVRTRTVSDCVEPKWNEQYTWRVYDPSTVLTVGVFDKWEAFESDGGKDSTRRDLGMGKVRIRLSNLITGKVYRSVFPLLLLTQTGLKRTGEIELAVRFARDAPVMDFLHVYSQPFLPTMHHLKPLGVAQQEALRATAAKIIANYLSRAEPPLHNVVVAYILDDDSQVFSMRKIRANWMRIINVASGVVTAVKWAVDTRSWKNPTSTMVVHILLVILIWFPDVILPTAAFYIFAVGAWNYRSHRRPSPPQIDLKMSLAEMVEGDELDEEFDTVPCSRTNEAIRVRYDKLRMIGTRLQILLGDIATQGERLQSLVTWRDPYATWIFAGISVLFGLLLYLLGWKIVAVSFGFYYFRHPVFRPRKQSAAVNFFRRLPSLSDHLL